MQTYLDCKSLVLRSPLAVVCAMAIWLGSCHPAANVTSQSQTPAEKSAAQGPISVHGMEKYGFNWDSSLSGMIEINNSSGDTVRLNKVARGSQTGPWFGQHGMTIPPGKSILLGFTKTESPDLKNCLMSSCSQKFSVAYTIADGEKTSKSFTDHFTGNGYRNCPDSLLHRYQPNAKNRKPSKKRNIIRALNVDTDIYGYYLYPASAVGFVALTNNSTEHLDFTNVYSNSPKVNVDFVRGYPKNHVAKNPKKLPIKLPPNQTLVIAYEYTLSKSYTNLTYREFPNQNKKFDLQVELAHTKALSFSFDVVLNPDNLMN